MYKPELVGGPRALTVRAGLSLVATLAATWTMGANPATASLAPFDTEVGHIQVSADAVGTNAASGIVEVEKPARGTVRKAYLFGASTGQTQYNPPDGAVVIDGAPVNWLSEHTLPSSIASYNVVSDVTSLVKSKIDGAPAGHVEFTVTEAQTANMDGEALVVIFDDPAVHESTVQIMYGAQATGGDSFDIGLAAPLKPSGQATMALGISYGYQPSGQYSRVDVNGVRLTTSAGGQDDGGNDNGELITIGGLGDSTANPDDPEADDSCAAAPRCDDELYDLKPFIGADDRTIHIDTVNPSDDDNIFASILQFSDAAVVGEGIVLEPSDNRVQQGTFLFLKALAQDSNGKPLANKAVTLTTDDGFTLQSTTGADGSAVFNYTSTSEGTDVVEASYVGDDGETHTSNQATVVWAKQVNATFGGEWPYHDGRLDLAYSYGGGHRYLGNVVQGARNWNDAGTNVHIADWRGIPYSIQIPISDYYERSDTYGYTTWPDGIEGCQQCTFVRTPIAFNQYQMDKQSDEQRTKVATHEMGHALGLAHPQGGEFVDKPSYASVMWQGPLRHNVQSTPQTFDTDRVKGMYP